MKKLVWPDYSLKGKKYGLDRVRKFLDLLGNPQDKLPPVFHVAGTNGKGSTTAFLKYILEASNCKVHRFTSPHLVNFNERIEISSKIISDNKLNKLSLECKKIVEKNNSDISWFEAIASMAFLGFSRNNADATILEVGLGGRLDATNVIKNPLVTIITPVSLDHMHILGDTIEKIAEEKAGIMKQNCPVIITKQHPSVSKILKKIAKEKGCEVYEYGKEWNVRTVENGFIFEGLGKSWKFSNPALTGEHQVINAGGAVAGLLCQNKILVSKESIEQGILNTKWNGRLQDLRGTKLHKLLPDNFELWLDGAHNEDGAKQIANWINDRDKRDKKPTVIVFGMLERKNPKLFLEKLKGNIEMLIAINIKNETKCIEAEELFGYAKDLGFNSLAKENFIEALKFISQKYKDKYLSVRIIICGSLYLVGSVLEKI